MKYEIIIHQFVFFVNTLNLTENRKGVDYNIMVSKNQGYKHYIFGKVFYNEIKDKFKPEKLPPKYATEANYVFQD